MVVVDVVAVVIVFVVVVVVVPVAAGIVQAALLIQGNQPLLIQGGPSPLPGFQFRNRLPKDPTIWFFPTRQVGIVKF